jgi:hypothetical protein
MRERRAVGAAAVVVVLTAAAGCSDDAEPQAAQPAEPAEPSTGSPTTMPSPTGPPDLSTLGEGRLEPGAYAFSPFGSDPAMPIPVMEVPDGFAAFRGFGVSAAKGPAFRSVAVWTVDTVDLQPCTAAGSTGIGPSPADLTDALARQQLTTTTDPEPFELAGQEGVYLEVTAPTGREFTDCAGTFDLWSNDGGGMRYLQAPGQVDRLWIFDLPGERLVIDATNTPGATPAQLEQLAGIVESVRFQQPAGP